jgi:hypothetical protein
MTTQEFSDAFDTLLNSYASQAVFGEEASKNEVVLDEYEKSVLLTQAQDIIVKAYFERNNESQGNGFDDSIRRQVDFSSLIKVAELTPVEDAEDSTFDDRGILYKMPPRNIENVKASENDGGSENESESESESADRPTDVLFILNEKMIVYNGIGSSKTKVKDYVVVPLNYKEYDREMSKAYAQPFKKQAWRLFQNSATGFDVQSELIPLWNIAENVKADTPTQSLTYKVRYVKRPDPIVLTDLPNDLTIDGVAVETQCSLNPIVHMDILNKAVEIALSTRGRVANVGRQQQQ